MTPLRSFFFLVWTLSAIYSVSGVPQFTGSGLRLGQALNGRQTSIPAPPQCDSTCDPVATIIGEDCSPSECCTPLFQSGYFECLKCVGQATNATMADWTVAQADVDGLTVACSLEGFALPKLTLPTQNPNRTLATASAGQASRTSVSQITISALSNTGSSLAPSTTNSQKTVTAISTQPSATQPSAPPSPTTSPSAAIPRNVGFEMVIGLLGVMLSIWTMT